MKRLALAALALLLLPCAHAQQPVSCPTRPLGDNTNACASTAFVQQNAGGGGSVLSVSNSNGTLTFSPNTGNVVGSLNLGNTNTWTAAQTFSVAPTLSSITGSVQCLHVSVAGLISGTGADCGAGGGGAVSSVSNVDSSLTVSPTTGSVVTSLNTANANTWTGAQTFNAGSSSSALTLSGITGMVQCLHVNNVGLVSGTGSDCGSGGGGGISSVTNSDGTLTFVTASGAVTGSLALGHPNTWTGAQIFTPNTAIGANLAPDSTLTINANTAPSNQLIGSNTSVHMIGADGTTNSFRYDSFGATNSIAAIRYDGINASRQGLVAGDNILAINAFGYDTSTLANSEIIRFFAGETWSPTAHGGYISVLTTPLTTASPVEMARFQPTGGLSVGSANVTTDPGNGYVLANAFRAVGPSAQFYAKATGSNGAFTYLDTSVTGQQSALALYDNGTLKWEVGRQTDNTFILYDVVGSKSVAIGYPNGGINFANGGGGGDPGQGNAYATTFKSALGTVTSNIASGSITLSTTAIASAACSAAQTATATGTLTTDVINVSFNGDPTAVTGYIPSTSGMLTIIPYPTANTVNFKVCNNTSASITPGAVTLNWRVAR